MCMYCLLYNYSNLHIHTSIHTHIHTYKHTNIQTHIHTHIHTNIHIHTHIHIHTNTHIHIHRTDITQDRKGYNNDVCWYVYDVYMILCVTYFWILYDCMMMSDDLYWSVI